MNRADATPRPRRWLRAPALIAMGAWLVIELLFIGQAIHMDSVDLWEAIQLTLPRTVMWLVFAPLAVALAFWFPLERGRLARSVAIHLAACVLLMAAVHRVFFGFAGTGSRSPTHESPSPVEQSSHESGTVHPPGGGSMAHIALAHLALNLLFYTV